MRVLTASIITALALIAAQAYAGNGDLIVKGTASIGTTTPVSPLTVGNALYSGVFPTLVGSQVNISDINSTTASSATATAHIVTQVNPSGDSSNVFSGHFAETMVPASSSFAVSAIMGNRIRTENLGSGTINAEYGSYTQAVNSSPTGTVNLMMGASAFSINSSTGVVSASYGTRGAANNNGGGTVTNQYGSFGYTLTNGTSTTTNQFGSYGWSNKTSSTTLANSYGAASFTTNANGTITTAYGMAIGDQLHPAIASPSGTVENGFGLYVGTIQATNRWSLFASDATAPSYFAGNVGIGTANPAFTLDVQGQVASNGVVLTSDAKFKKNLLSITSPLEKVLNLNGLSYEWKIDEYAEKNFPAGRHYGVIAQEIEKVLPEVVNTDAKGDKSVAYSEIIPVLIEAIKEQQKIIVKQQEELKELRTLILK
jgi:trimeric autotransporter adhesin